MHESSRRPSTPDTLRSVRVERAPLLKRIKRDFATYQKMGAKAAARRRSEEIRDLEERLKRLKNGSEEPQTYHGYDYDQAHRSFQKVIDLLSASTATHVVLRSDEAETWAGERNGFIRALDHRTEKRRARRA